MEGDKEDLRIAVFFDAENINPKYTPAIISELEKSGMGLFQRIYVDWTLPNMQGSNWKDLISKTPIMVFQQFHNGEKQVADKTIIMDAVELAIKQDNIDSGAFALCPKLETVHFKGSKKQWQKVKILGGNEDLTRARVVFEN